MSNSFNPSEATNSRPLNLAKFVSDNPPAESVEEGPTLRLKRIASEIVDKKADATEPANNFGLPLKEMLGVITHCYVRGVFCSKDIAQLLRDDQALRKAFGRALPDEGQIRAFRRRHANDIEEALEGLYRAYPGGGPDAATPDTSEGTQQLRREAAERLYDAAHTDNSKGRLG